MMNDLFLTPINSESDAQGFLFTLVQLGLNFHPEENAQNILARDGSRLFTDSEVEDVNERMKEVFMYLDDPCAYILDIMYVTDRL